MIVEHDFLQYIRRYNYTKQIYTQNYQILCSLIKLVTIGINIWNTGTFLNQIM